MKKLRRVRAHLRGGTLLARRFQSRIISPLEELIRREFTRLRASARRQRIQLRARKSHRRFYSALKRCVRARTSFLNNIDFE